MFRRNQQPKIDPVLLQNPPMPAKLPVWVKPDDIAFVERQAASLLAIPWSQQPERDPTLAFDHYLQGLTIILDAGGNFAKLNNAIPELLRCPPDLALTGAAQIMMRLSYLSGSRYVPQGIDTALDFATQAIKANPQCVDAWLARAQILCNHVNDAALPLAALALDKARSLPHNVARLANVESLYYKRLDKKQERIACLTRALQGTATDQLLPAERMGALDGLAFAYDSIGDTQRAILVFDELNGSFPQSAWGWHNASIILDKVGRTQEALAKSTTALRIMRFGNAIIFNALFRLKLGLPTPDLENPATADEREWAITSRVKYAIWLEKQGPATFAAADQQYRLAVQLDPNRVTTYVDYADFQEKKLNRLDIAAELYRECVRLRPALASYRLYLAKTLAKMGPAYGAAAEQEFQTLLAKDPKYIDVRCDYARFLFSLGPSRRMDAQREIQMALKFSPTNAAANALLKEFSGARPQNFN